MTTLLTIPGATAFHLPAPGIPPVALAEGDLTLSLIPAFPPDRPNEAITLTVGGSTFVLTTNAPVQRTNSKNEHPSLVFTPAPLSDGRSIGQVRIDFRDSRNPDEWEMTEQAYTALQAELKTFGLWEVKVLFVDDEYELGKLDTAPKVGWGEAISSNFMWGVSKLLGRKPEEAGLPTSVPVPSPGVHSTLGPKPAPKAAAAPAPRAVPQPAPGGQQPGEFRALASHSWTQASIAAQGIGAAAVAAGAAIGSNVRDAVDHLGAPSVPDKDAPPTPTKDVSISPYEVATPVVKKEEVTAIQPETKTEGETGVVAEVNKDDAEDKVSEVADKVAAVKIEEPKIEEPKIVEPKIEEKKAEDAKVEEKEVEEAQNEIAKPEAAIKPEALIEEKIEKKEVADDVDMLDSAPATPAETATPTEADDEDEEEDDKADATESTEAVKTAPKKKNKKKGKKGKN